MALQSRFNFTGTVLFPKETSKVPFFKSMTSKDNRKMVRINFGIKEGGTNLAFVEAFGGIQKTIKTMNTDNEKVEIDWDNRFDEDVVKTVANYRTYTVDLGQDYGGRADFISQYDFILHLKEWLPKYKGKICATGQFAKDWYKDRYLDKFKISNIYAVEDDVKSRLAVTLDLFYNKDSVDKVDFKAEQKIYIDGYVSQYINKDEGTKFIPQRVVFNASKYDLENEKHKKLFDYKMKYVDVSKKAIVHMLWDCVLLNGAEEVEFDESMLTPSQREQVELGIKTLDDFKPRGNIFGDRIVEIRLFEPKLIGDFADGLADSEMKQSEFDDLIHVPSGKVESLDEVVKKAEKAEDVDIEVDEDDLF